MVIVTLILIVKLLIFYEYCLKNGVEQMKISSENRDLYKTPEKLGFRAKFISYGRF